MSAAAAAQVGEQPITKSEFARRRKVTPGRVSQWISEGKIDGAALIGQGREQKIVETVACEQLKTRLDTSQRFGNGLGTSLDPPQAPSAAAAPAQVLPLTPKATGGDAIADQIARERLEQIQRANRREAIEEAAEAGRLTDAATAAQAAGRQAAQMVATFEGALPEFAAAVAAKFELPYRDVLHLLRGKFRDVRISASELLKRQACELPELVPVDIETNEHDDGPDIERRSAGDGGDSQGVGTPAAG